MTRHYTHTSEAAATTAVAALPSILGDAPTAKAPLAPRMVEADAVLKLAERLTAKTAADVRRELVALCE